MHLSLRQRKRHPGGGTGEKLQLVLKYLSEAQNLLMRGCVCGQLTRTHRLLDQSEHIVGKLSRLHIFKVPPQPSLLYNRDTNEVLRLSLSLWRGVRQIRWSTSSKAVTETWQGGLSYRELSKLETATKRANRVFGTLPPQFPSHRAAMLLFWVLFGEACALLLGRHRLPDFGRWLRAAQLALHQARRICPSPETLAGMLDGTDQSMSTNMQLLGFAPQSPAARMYPLELCARLAVADAQVKLLERNPTAAACILFRFIVDYVLNDPECFSQHRQWRENTAHAIVDVLAFWAEICRLPSLGAAATMYTQGFITVLMMVRRSCPVLGRDTPHDTLQEKMRNIAAETYMFCGNMEAAEWHVERCEDSERIVGRWSGMKQAAKWAETKMHELQKRAERFWPDEAERYLHPPSLACEDCAFTMYVNLTMGLKKYETVSLMARTWSEELAKWAHTNFVGPVSDDEKLPDGPWPVRDGVWPPQSLDAWDLSTAFVSWHVVRSALVMHGLWALTHEREPRRILDIIKQASFAGDLLQRRARPDLAPTDLVPGQWTLAHLLAQTLAEELLFTTLADTRAADVERVHGFRVCATARRFEHLEARARAPWSDTLVPTDDACSTDWTSLS